MDNLGMLIPMLICVIMSAYFSATETAFNSLNVTKMKIAAERGDRTADLVLRLLPEIVPDLKFTLMIKDDNLQELGFVKSAPCTVNFDIDAEGFEKILDMLMDIETAAYNLSEEEEDSAEFKKYQRYKNLWGILYNAKQL